MRYRIEVGRNQLALPKDIVGAIANETGLDSRRIGRIDLFEDHSTVELPADLPKETLDVLRRVRVRQCPLNIRPLGADEPPSPARPARGTKPARKPGPPVRKPAGRKERTSPAPRAHRKGKAKPKSGK